ncbi:hypothetical protein X943_003329 [Babesia divergens]|uniref:Uncharacterized protein n=1 Tax=Babesia divergens TaxID=32595 RepID=A0AAD9LJM7_BABDI|nr:hypothetical protein X943_003329 [Babesia divergens]
MWSQIRGLENRVNILQHENKELESHLLQQSIDLQRYFVLKCTSQGKDAELINQGRRITSLEEQLAQERHKVKQLRNTLEKWQQLSTKRAPCIKGSFHRSQSETDISQSSRSSRRNTAEKSTEDVLNQHLRDELANMRRYRATQEERLRKMDEMLKNEVRKVRLELACALKSKDQLFKYCCLTSTANLDETFQDIEATLLRVAEVDPSYIEACRKSI